MLRSPVDPARPAPSSAGAWLLGFHGTVPVAADGFGGFEEQPPSLRSIALARRSIGLEPMSVFTDLPSLRRKLVEPNRSNGAVPVGHNANADTPMAAVAVGHDPDDATTTAMRVKFGDPVLPGEPVPAYLDRQLLKARVLYLPNRSWAYAIAKRAVDIVVSSLLILLSAPIMIVLAIWIKRDSPGPALFRQQRITCGGRLFTFYKFRTMWVDAKDRFPDLYDYGRMTASGELFYKLADDPRSTRAGKLLRRTTLDELPNLFNVLLGDMSLVGPRPELPDLLSCYRPEELALFFTKSGVTGLAQIAGRSLLTVRERINLDMRYLANQTLLLDLRILLRTVGAVLQRRGAF